MYSSETNSCRFVLKTRQRKLHFQSVVLKIHAVKNIENITGELGQGCTDSLTESEFTDSILFTRLWVCFWLSLPACLMHHTHFTAFKHIFLPRDGCAPGPSLTFSIFTARCSSCHTISQGRQLPSPYSPCSPLSHSGADQKLWKRRQSIAMLTSCWNSCHSE